MGRKLPLPLFNLGRGLTFTASPRAPQPGKKPSADEVRARLGGRAATGPGAGELVTLTTSTGSELPGVVLFVAGDDLDVWVETALPRPPTAALLAPASNAGVVHRVTRAAVVPLHVPASKQLTTVAADARIFAALGEGQRIHYQTDAGLREGTLVEKCRYGALVASDDGVLIAVGFRRVWPANAEQHSEN
ncbi:hypothetical protein [Chondromyces apiculatus]|uniref:Uncharacterized protein n=1 Tax=Chondromyces apiculatus DSM 436 TaxID=1192034 RepID=A0A017SZ43_9BACT|nr:hypothetical protein [Chondromyces apiculatus]EYF02027.1 Hypothetical protein CAP_7506 [Chondromyces apiculatus DSM 436]